LERLFLALAEVVETLAQRVFCHGREARRGLRSLPNAAAGAAQMGDAAPASCSLSAGAQGNDGGMGQLRAVTPAERAVGASAGPVGRPVRAVLALVLGAVLLSAALWGANDDWPFAPMLQYALPSKAGGVVWVTHAYGTFANGQDKVLDADDVGLRSSELDSQGQVIASQPALLRELGRYYRTHSTRGPALVVIRIERDAIRLRPGKTAIHLPRRRVLGQVRL
jgi:hypothetical protein